jgi:hypothetical protein
MNQERFDELTRAMATTRISRTRMLKMFVATALGTTLGGGSLLVGTEEAEAKDQPKKHCSPEGARCSKDEHCCSGQCTDKVMLADNTIFQGKCCPDCNLDQCLRCDTRSLTPQGATKCIDVCVDAESGSSPCKCLECDGQGSCISKCDPTQRCEECVGVGGVCTCRDKCEANDRCTKCDGQGNCVRKCGECQDCGFATGYECEDKFVCAAGASMDPTNGCQCKCPEGQIVCASPPVGEEECVDTDTNALNCGTCGRECNSECEICEGGECVPLPGKKPCGDACCGPCQVCEDPTTGKCRECSACETCPVDTCVSKAVTCVSPNIFHPASCLCCPPPPPPPPPPGPGACVSQLPCFCGQRPMGNPPTLGNVYCSADFGFKCCTQAATGYAYCCKSHEKCNPAGGCLPC